MTESGTVEIHNHIPEFGGEPDYGALSSEQMDRRHRDEDPDEEEEFVEFLAAGSLRSRDRGWAHCNLSAQEL